MAFQYDSYIKSLYQSLFLPTSWSIERIGTLLAFSTIYPFAELINSISWELDNYIYPEYENISVNEPIFIIGNPRSGTTFMHRLMSLDEDRFVTFKFSDVLVVPILAKKFFNLLDLVDDTLGGTIKGKVSDWQNSNFKNFDKIHRLRFDEPEEDEGVLAHCWATPFVSVAFPVETVEKWKKFDKLPHHLRLPLMEFFNGCVKRLLYFHKKETHQLLSKNPMFSTKIRTLVETFPSAKFVYLLRNPYLAIASSHNMLGTLWGLQYDFSKNSKPHEKLTDWLIYSYRYAIDQLDKLSPSQYIIIYYDDLVSSPKDTIEKVYAYLGYDFSLKLSDKLLYSTERQKHYKGENIYSLEEMGISKTYIYEQLADIFMRFRFDPKTGNLIS